MYPLRCWTAFDHLTYNWGILIQGVDFRRWKSLKTKQIDEAIQRLTPARSHYHQGNGKMKKGGSVSRAQGPVGAGTSDRHSHPWNLCMKTEGDGKKIPQLLPSCYLLISHQCFPMTESSESQLARELGRYSLQGSALCPNREKQKKEEERI